MRQITKHNRAGKKKNRISLIACMLVLVFLMTGCGKNSDGVIRITNVSYDPTREFYEAYNSLFEKYYEDTYGKNLIAYVVIVLGSFLLISIDNLSMMTNFSAVVACFNNIGPGFDAVGPTCNFSAFSGFSKVVLIFDMLAGRLEIFPILILASKSTWSRK